MPTDSSVQRGFPITGKVQGVFFRAWTRDLAEELGLSGTVRNRRDGSVEAHARGAEEAVALFENRLWDGPPAAVVQEVRPVDSAEILVPGRFEILPTR